MNTYAVQGVGFVLPCWKKQYGPTRAIIFEGRAWENTGHMTNTIIDCKTILFSCAGWPNSVCSISILSYDHHFYRMTY